MAVDAFIWFEKSARGVDVPGDGSHPAHPSGFEVKDFSFGVENPTTIGSAGGGAGAGKIKFNEFTIKKMTDKASPTFFKICATGDHFPKATLELRKQGTDGGQNSTPFLVFEFGTVFTTKIDWSGPGDEGPEESITFAYGQLDVEYNAPGGQPPQFEFGWDQIRNRQWDGQTPPPTGG